MDKLLLAAETAADEAEVYLQKVESTDVTFQNGALEKIENEQTVGVALRILKNGRLGFAYTTNHGEWSWLLENALASAEIAEEVGLSLPVTKSFSPVTAFSPGIKEIGAEGMVSEGFRILDAVARLRPGITADCYLGRTVERIKIMNSKRCFSIRVIGLPGRMTWKIFQKRLRLLSESFILMADKRCFPSPLGPLRRR